MECTSCKCVHCRFCCLLGEFSRWISLEERKTQVSPAFFGTIFPSLCVSLLSLGRRADEWRIGAEARHVTPQLSSANDGGNGTRHCSGTARAALEISHQWQMTALGRSTASLHLCGTFVQHCCCSDTVTTAATAVATADDKMATPGQKKSHETISGIFVATGFVIMGLYYKTHCELTMA